MARRSVARGEILVPAVELLPLPRKEARSLDHAAVEHGAVQGVGGRDLAEHRERQIEADEARPLRLVEDLMRHGAPEEHEIAGLDGDGPAVEPVGHGAFGDVVDLDLAVHMGRRHEEDVLVHVGAESVVFEHHEGIFGRRLQWDAVGLGHALLSGNLRIREVSYPNKVDISAGRAQKGVTGPRRNKRLGPLREKTK
jgi:hypothetical protein